MTQTHTDEIESALDACDAVRTTSPSDAWDDDISNWVLQAFIEYGTETTEPLEDVFETYNLQIWNADFETPLITLARREGFSYGCDIDRSERVADIDDLLRRESEVRRTETFIHPEPPRFRVRLEIEYGERSPGIPRVLQQYGLAIHSVNFRRGMVTVVPIEELTYGGVGE